ncbi:aminopeptidase N [Alteromonas sp. a30]|uniref:aminopeptidase N n=1 Tax=Alteromonas sp. a30 TaxID=2730917 RepID=UPI00227DDB3C|nr:aminopeptidase N [Alteromonas sp. a30]MCY7293909.1 aminopeptidase N [Alteromonas sp. a30]
MTNTAPVAKKRLDYVPPQFLIDTVDLTFWLEPNETKVMAKSHVRRNGEHQEALVLDGEQLTLLSVKVNGEVHTDYQALQGKLVLNALPDEFVLEIENQIDPENNTSLEGLYLSNGTFCTQCEAEGFRKITYFLDRPDVLATYSVTLYADKTLYPSLLANGNCIEKGELDNGKHWVKWHDPFKKPSYLFALVAGQFDIVEDTYTTMSGREVQLQLFVDIGNASRAHHALESLKKSMRWDEDTFGLEYDLDIYMIVAVDFFNMGAMENKGLNIFNSKCVLADSQAATDDDFFNVESIIAHEYFHNWTGNRVTCRDWFQLSLKEGLTVFRDQQFSSDMSSPVINRINQVKVMREHQFAEDSGPMSHPIRPDEVIEMNNFYTVTVYDKGAEVIRMMHTLLGVEGFRKGMDLYFQRHDGQAVTCDDFVSAMEQANSKDLTLFRRWYSQSGTPEVTVKEDFDDANGRYTLTLTQETKPTADQTEKSPLHIPVDISLLNANGEAEALNANGDTHQVLELTQDSQSFEFSNLKQKPVVDLFRSFSAPVKVHFEQSIDELSHIIRNSTDDFSRWEAGQKLYLDAILEAVENKQAINNEKSENIISILDTVLVEKPADLALLAELFSVPNFDSVAQLLDSIDVDHLYSAISDMKQRIAKHFSNKMLQEYLQMPAIDYQYEPAQVAQRRFKNVCLSNLASNQDNANVIVNQFEKADNMTDVLGALKAAQKHNLPVFDNLMASFEQKWRDDVLVLDKWFALHAEVESDDILSRLALISSHAQYTLSNPNRVRAVVGAFAFRNTLGFHKNDGSGYRYVADAVIELNRINPQVASRIITPLSQWKKYQGERRDLMQGQLIRIADEPDLSSDIFEKVTKALQI